MEIKLEDFSLRELKDLKVRVEKMIATYEDRKKSEARAELEEAARKLGYSLSELTAISAPRKRAAATPKYANPADPSQTWTGRGRRPRWVEAALKSGKSLEDILIG